MLSNRISQLQSSSTIAINRRVLELRADGKQIISFGIGEPNFDVPQKIKEAAIEAINNNFSRYTASDGIKELKQAIIRKFSRDNNLEYEEKNIIVGTGAKQCLYNFFQAVLNGGDEVIIPSPYWLSYPEQIKLSGGTPVFADTAPSFKLKAEQIAKAITNKTKIIVLNSPNNPTGMMIEKEELLKIGELAIEKNIFIVSDEVYEYFIYPPFSSTPSNSPLARGRNGLHISIASLGKEIKDRTITINGLSKSAGMTGWRLGYAAGPEEIISAMRKIQEQTTSNPTSIIQKAAISALDLGKDWMADILKDFEAKRDFACQKLTEIGFEIQVPEGAFYIFFDVSKYFNNEIKNSLGFCADLLDKAGVALIPGGSFGNDNCARLSYAADWNDLKSGMEKIQQYLTPV